MAKQIWRGDAEAVAQVTKWLFAGTWLSTEHVTLTINGKTVVEVTGSTSITTLLGNVVAQLAASTITEFTEITWSADSTHLIATAATPGVPFAATASTDSASGTIDGASSSSGTATTASAGPADWSTAANWSSGSVPANSDDAYFTNNSNPCLYFGPSNQSSVTLNSLNIDSTYTAPAGIGLPKTNGSGSNTYQEYRDQYLKIGATTINIGLGTGSGTGRIKIDCGTVATTVNLFSTGAAIEAGVPAVLINGTNVSNVANLLKGSIGFGFFAGDTNAKLATLNVGWTTNQSGDVNCVCGPNVTQLTTVNKTGGTLVLNSAPTTLNQGPGQQAGDSYLYNGVPTTLAITGGRVFLVSGGTITTVTVSGLATLDCRQGTAALTFTNTTLGAKMSLYDPSPGKRITFTNPFATTCSLSDFTAFDLGSSHSYQRS